MTRLEIDPDDLMLALTWTSEALESRYYLDSETGAALLDYPEARESWFRFENDFEMRQAAAWCEEHDIEPMWHRQPASS